MPLNSDARLSSLTRYLGLVGEEGSPSEVEVRELHQGVRGFGVQDDQGDRDGLDDPLVVVGLGEQVRSLAVGLDLADSRAVDEASEPPGARKRVLGQDGLT